MKLILRRIIAYRTERRVLELDLPARQRHVWTDEDSERFGEILEIQDDEKRNYLLKRFLRTKN
jgi:hypothetical protein